MKTRALLLLFLGIARGWAEEPLTLARVLEEVRTENPRVRSAIARAEAERETIPQVSAWEDPTVGIESMRTDTLRPTTYSALEFSAAQKIPVTVARRRRVELAKAQANVAEREVSAQLVPLLIEAADAFFRLARARELLELTHQNDEILARAVAAVQARLAEGGSDVTNVLLAETERARLQEQIIELQRESAEATTLLNALRNLPPQTPIGSLATNASADEPAFGTYESLQERALAFRPELRVAEAQITAAVRATEVARAWLPDPEVMVKTRRVKGSGDPISEYDVGVAISVPWIHRGKYHAAIRETQRRREAAELDAAALRTQTAAELRDAWTRYEAAQRLVTLYQGRLVPLADRAVEAARTGLDSGRTGILELITSQKNQREIRNALAGAHAERARALAKLEAMTGQTLRLP